MIIVNMTDIIILNLRRFTSVNTFNSSMNINAVNVIETMLTNESLKNIIENSIITDP